MGMLIQAPGTCTDRTLPKMNPLWTPEMLDARLALRLTAEQGVTASGGVMSAWADLPRGKSLSLSAGGGAQTTYDFNGIAVPRLTLDGYSYTGSITSAAGYRGFFMVLDLIDASAAQQMIFHTDSFACYRLSSGALMMTGLQASGGRTFGVLSAGKHVVFCYSPDGSNYKMQIDGVQSGLTFSGAVTGLITNIRLGQYDPGLIDAGIAEFGLTSGVITEAEVAKLVGYAAHHYGITSVLPSDHPYKTAAPRKLS